MSDRQPTAYATCILCGTRWHHSIGMWQHVMKKHACSAKPARKNAGYKRVYACRCGKRFKGATNASVMAFREHFDHCGECQRLVTEAILAR